MENGCLVGQPYADQVVCYRTTGRQGVSHHPPSRLVPKTVRHSGHPPRDGHRVGRQAATQGFSGASTGRQGTNSFEFGPVVTGRTEVRLRNPPTGI